MSSRRQSPPGGMIVKFFRNRAESTKLPTPWPAPRPAEVLGEADLDRIAEMLEVFAQRTEERAEAAYEQVFARIVEALEVSGRRVEAAHEQFFARSAKREQLLIRIAELEAGQRVEATHEQFFARIVERLEADQRADVAREQVLEPERPHKKTITTQDVANLVDAAVDGGLTITQARKSIATQLRKTVDAVTQAHLRFGRHKGPSKSKRKKR
jgi:hypothetical protein